MTLTSQLPTSTPTGAETLVDTLTAHGVTRYFGIPGEHCLDIVDAVGRRPELQFVSVRHESAAAFMAEAHGKLTGRPAACVATASVGSVNLLAGVNVAHHDSTPMVVIVGQVATNWLGREAWQEIDQVSMFRPLCRSVTEVSTPVTLSEQAHRAVTLATSGRPGPVLLSVPVDLQAAPSEGPVVTPGPIRPPGPGERATAEITELIERAQRPLVVVGGGILASDARDELVRFAEVAALPVVTAFRRTDAFPNDSSHYVGALGLSASPVVREALESADLILVIGTRFAELNTFRYAIPTESQQVVHIDVEPRTLAALPAPATLGVVSDARLALTSLIASCEKSSVRSPTKWWQDLVARSGAARPHVPGAEPMALIEGIAEEIDALAPNDAVITTDAGDFFLGCAPVIRLVGRRRLLGPTSGTMGYGLPAAIAAKLQDPSRTVVALCGDGGFMMSVQELETAVRHNANVIVVVFNNKGYGSIVRHQKQRFDTRLVGTRLGGPPLAELAELFGVDGHVVSSRETFRSVFRAALVAERPTLIEVPT